MKNKLEIPIKSIHEINKAELAGADSLELSINMEKGGMTPDLDLFTDMIWTSTIPCYLVLRPNYYSYEVTDVEFENNILHFLEIAKITGMKGVSVGILKDGVIDKERIKKIIERKGDLEIHFSHAIDSSMNYEEDLEWLINNEHIARIATSGSADTIFDGFTRLEKFKDKINGKLTIGKSISKDNIHMIFENGYDNVVIQARYSLLDFNKQLDYEKIKELKEEIMKYN